MKRTLYAGLVACIIASTARGQTSDSSGRHVKRFHKPPAASIGNRIIQVRGQIDDDEIVPVGHVEEPSTGNANGEPALIRTASDSDDEATVNQVAGDTTNTLTETPAEPTKDTKDVGDSPAIVPTGIRLIGSVGLSKIAPIPTATCDQCNHPVDQCGCDGRGLTFFGEYLLLQPRGADPIFAVRALTCTTPPIGTEQIDFGAFSGFKTGIAKSLHDGCSELVASFTFFEATEEDHAPRTTGNSIIRPVLTFDPLATCDAATSTLARATAGIDFDRVDIDLRNYIDCGCTRLDWLVGFGYAQLSQDLRAIYDVSRVAVDADLWGYGVRLGGGATYGRGRVRGYGHGDLTLLASNVKTHFRETNNGAGVVATTAAFDQEQDRIVPIVDLEFGLAADLCKNTVVKVGYTYSIWFNVVTTPEFVQAVQRNDLTGTSDTLTFDGLFARVEFTW